ncbi:MAG: protein kinase [Planctomycetota bacterium]|nr:protein kinase [Planctomycetota bacterium]
MPPSPPVEFSGSTRFEILRTLGSGGMGVVYLAKDRETGQLVALKTMRDVDPTAIFRFKQEFRSLSELVHPNLVRMHELFCEQDQWYFVMEVVEGAMTFQKYLLRAASDQVPQTSSLQGAQPSNSSMVGTESGSDPESKTRDAQDDRGEVSQTNTFAPGKRENVTNTILSTPAECEATFTSVPAESSPSEVSADPSETPTLVPSASDSPSASVSFLASDADIPVRPVARSAPAERGVLAVTDIQRLRDAFRQLTAGVRRLHRAGMLHRDLKPANALVSNSGTVILLDFGLVAELSAKSKGPSERNLAGTIDYMSPEQAQVLPLTEASDWYSVGVMLFQALTGRVPFTGTAMQRLQHKVAADAPAPADVVEGVPADLNALCVRLMNRVPELRPKGSEVSAFFGADDSLEDRGAETLNSVFIGRERQLAELEEAFAQVRSGETVVARVHGRSGAGKSALIQAFLDRLNETNQATILTGRCYEQESVPFKGVDSLIDAVAQFLRTTEIPLRMLIPEHVVALARIFPVLKRVKSIHEECQSDTVTNDLQELRRQAFGAFRELFWRIGRIQPLVVYLDDLQWGDIDSAALLTDLLGGERAPRMLLLAAYRSEYADSSVCLQALLRCEATRVIQPNQPQAPPEPENPNPESEFDSSFVNVGTATVELAAEALKALQNPASGSTARWKEVLVDALTPDETRLLARNLLRPDLPDREASADRIAQQSQGGAYFVHELARHLNSGLDLNAISGDGLDEVLWAHVRRLPAEAQRVLEVVAVSGQPIALRNVLDAANLESVPPRVLATLRLERLLRSNGPGMQAEVEAFHDRVRESIVNRLESSVLRTHHARLADVLERSGDAQPETVAGHLEAGGNPEKAGRFYTEAAKLALQKLAFDRAEEFSKHALRLAHADVDRVVALERLIHFYTDMARFADAYEQGRKGARDFGVELPAGFVPPLFVWDFVQAKWRLRGRKTADLVNLPEMRDPRRVNAVRLINATAKAAYQVRPELCVAISTKVVNLCLKSGNTPDCAICWMVFGAIFQGGVMGNHPVGHEFGQLALSIIDKFQQERQRPEVTFVVGYFGTSWLRPATEAEALWRITYDSGRATGDLFHTGCACAATIQSLLMRGVRFSEIWAQADRYLNFLKPMNLREPIGAIRSVRQLIRNLCGKSLSPSTFSTSGFDEAEYVAGLANYGSRHFAHYYYVNKMLSQYLWGEYDAALATSQTSAGYLKDSPGMLHAAEHHFLTGLILAAQADRQTGWARRKSIRGVRKSAARLVKWAAHCPHNFEHKSQLLKGEQARLTGAPAEAVAAYQGAIEAAGRFGYKHVEGIAHQLAYRFQKSAGDQDAARRHQALAERCFLEWGATSHLNWDR